MTRSTKKRTRRVHKNSGFTLLELLLVLSILVVIGGFVVGNLVGVSKEANEDATRAQIGLLKPVIQRYQLKMNSLPENLEALRDGPSDADKKEKWSGAYIDSIPNDAWNNPFEYSVTGDTYEIRSSGNDGQANTDDDIIVTGP
ncbi:Type II secretion system protein G precursor [Novipirellula aureliae]|uniref:Type II secretion system protein G n=1 Tax=Novipirellula aureliae TaxID=2527966 RepID=A0A5C6E7I9_9BACT|nr:type II secretion system protein GspG [Novipirellula aureliae]TWU43179.1 Type II secretion system protein G precursor [Novipirellula aureliae]